MILILERLKNFIIQVLYHFGKLFDGNLRMIEKIIPRDLLRDLKRFLFKGTRKLAAFGGPMLESVRNDSFL